MAISDDLINNKKRVDSKEIIDYAISLQINKINQYTWEHPKSTLSTATEEAMVNLIELIKLRNNYQKENKKF